MDILDIIKNKAREKSRKILLVEGEDERLIKAAAMAVENRICEPTLLGDKDVIIKLAAKMGLHLDGIGILDYKNDVDKYANELYELRKHKGMTLEQAKETLQNPNFFGALMLKLDKFDGAVGGCKYSTADWMRPVFQIVKPKEGISLVSAICFMPVRGKTYFFSDTDFIIKPDAEQLAQIAINANDFVKGMGIEPKVVLLSYSTKGSSEHPSLEFIRDALNIVKKKRNDIVIDGEMQFDAAVNPDAAKKKCPDSMLKGDANVLIFPDITSANITVHSLSQWTDFKFIGSFPIGLAKPVINGGRSFNAEQIYNLIMACAMEANMEDS